MDMCANCGMPIRTVERRMWCDGSQRHMDCDENKDAEIRQMRTLLTAWLTSGAMGGGDMDKLWADTSAFLTPGAIGARWDAA